MRDIKFRAWDKSVKEFADPGLSMRIDGLICSSHREHYILMQYTGLKDKNGVEIYESDVVKYIGRLYKVVYKNGSFILFNENEGFFYFTDMSPNLLEVIGNIYENKEPLDD